MQSKFLKGKPNEYNMIGLVACDENGVIGYQGKLPWHLPKDLAFFRQQTTGNVMVMGRKTYDAIPIKVFETRTGIVLSKQQNPLFVNSLDVCLKETTKWPNKKIFVIGGGEIFDLFFKHNLISCMLVTHVKGQYPGDAFFDLNWIKGWKGEVIAEESEFVIKRYVN